MKEKIDVVILTSNEEEVIENAIKSVKDFAENVFIIDSGSTDRTRDIAEKNKVTFIEHKFDNFSDQRNYALKKVKSPWIFYLDADEVVAEEFKEELQSKLSEISEEISGFIVKRKTYYYGRDWGFTDEVARIFKVKNFEKWNGIVHETPEVKGALEKINSPIKHYTHRNLEQMLNKTNKWSDYEAKLRFEDKHPKMKQWRFIRVMFTEFIRSYVKEKGYKNGTYGFIEAFYQSFSIFITYAKLWEMQIKKK